MGEDLVAFGVGVGLIGFPFVIIFLLLKVIKWGSKKSLFSDSWFVYLGWMISGIIGFFTYEYISKSFPTNENFFFKTPFILIIAFQACTLTTILYNRGRLKKEFSLQYRKKENRQAPSLEEACKTAFLVSVLTSLIVWGLIAALQIMQDKPSSPYGLYDN